MIYPSRLHALVLGHLFNHSLGASKGSVLIRAYCDAYRLSSNKNCSRSILRH